jgi:hypothetical protein
MIRAARLPCLVTAVGLAGFSLGPARTLSQEWPAGQPSPRKEYRLVQTHGRSEIDRGFLQKIDALTPPFPPGSPYQVGDVPVVAGRFTVHKFVALYRGKSAEGEKDFHDLLVVETDDSGLILDAVHYTLEWTDLPTLDLYRLGAKGVTLRDGLRVLDLRLVNVRTKEPLADEGTIVLKMGTIQDGQGGGSSRA